MPSHIVVVLVVKDIAHEQNDGLVAVVLPPMRGAARLRPDLAGFMHDRIGAVAGVFDDLPLGDVDDRGTIGVAVPGHDAPGSIVSLRKRSWRLLSFAGSFSRSMAASTVSVTPLPAWAAGMRTSALNLPGGHSPATDADKPASVEPAIMPARTRLRPNPRPLAMRLNIFVISFVMPQPQRGGAED